MDVDDSNPGTSEEDKSIPIQTKESSKYCWVCFATDEEDRDAAWVKPCKCRGTTKWVCILFA